MKVKPGDIVVIDNVTYKFGESSSRAFNAWYNILEDGGDDSEVTIHLYTFEDNRIGDSFPPSKIKEALEKADFNKTPHGL